MAAESTLSREAARRLLLLAVLAAPSITTFESALALALLAWALSRFSVVPGQEGAAPWLLAPLAMLGGWSLISALASPEPAAAARRCAGMLVWMAAPMAAMLLDEWDRRRVQALLLGLSGVLGLWGVAEGLLLWDGDPLLRARGPFSHHLTLAGFLLIGLLQALPRPDLAPLLGRRAAWGRILGQAAVGMAALGLLATFSRGAALALGAGLAVVAAGALGGRRIGRRRGLALVPLAVGVVLAVALPALAAWRSPELLQAARASSTDRWVLWRAGWEGIRDNPFLGIGAGRTAQDIPPRLPPGYRRPGPPSHLHSTPLTLALERGVPALLGWVLFLVGLFRAGGRVAWAEGAGAVAAVAGAVVLGLFEDNLGDSEVAFAFMVTAGRLHGAALRAGHPPDGAAAPGAGGGWPRRPPG